MNVRLASLADLDTASAIYARARVFMRENGNPTQWGDSYPSLDLIRSDILGENLYIIEDSEGTAAGLFAFFPNGDPDYNVINGAWLNDEPYAAIHRIASSGAHKGVFSHILDFCLARSSNIKVDTHAQNTVMQSVLKKHGFSLCGTITADGSEFLAFQFSRCM